MAARSTEKPATYADLEALPSNMVGEIVRGVLYANPRPALPHAAAASAIGEEIGPPFKRGRGGPGGWMILYEPELHLDADVLVPDLAGWRRERMPELPDTAAFELAPDWVCEVLSPSTEAADRAEKMPIYGREGVGHVWLVDPVAQTLEVFQLEASRWIMLGTWRDDAWVRAAPFAELDLELAGLWAK